MSDNEVTKEVRERADVLIERAFRRLSQIAREAVAAKDDDQWLAALGVERARIIVTLEADGLVSILADKLYLTYNGVAMLAKAHGLDVRSVRAPSLKTDEAE